MPISHSLQRMLILGPVLKNLSFLEHLKFSTVYRSALLKARNALMLCLIILLIDRFLQLFKTVGLIQD